MNLIIFTGTCRYQSFWLEIIQRYRSRWSKYPNLVRPNLSSKFFSMNFTKFNNFITGKFMIHDLFLYRIIHHITKVHFELKSHSQQSIHLSRQKYASKQRSTIQTLMRRARFVYQSYQLKTGSQQQNVIKVSSKMSIIAHITWLHSFLIFNSNSSFGRVGKWSRAGTSTASRASWRVSQGSQEVYEKCWRAHSKA